MSAPVAATCPECGEARLPGHPGGFVWDHTGMCSIGNAEQGTQVADLDTAAWGNFARPVTTAELTLLAACGVVLPTDAATLVVPITPSLRCRSWPGVTLDPAPPDDAA